MRNAVMVVTSVLFLSLFGCAQEDLQETADDVASTTSAVEDTPTPTDTESDWWVYQNCMITCNHNWDRSKAICRAYYGDTGQGYWDCIDPANTDYWDCYNTCKLLDPYNTGPGRPGSGGGACLPQLPGCGI